MSTTCTAATAIALSLFRDQVLGDLGLVEVLFIFGQGPEPGRGRTYVDLWQRSGKDPNCHVGVDVDGPGFIDVLVDRLKSLE